jgi:hypothetical protein
MSQRKSFWVRAVAYISVALLVSLMFAFILVAVFEEGAVTRIAAACSALACLVAARYISTQAWGKAKTAK